MIPRRILMRFLFALTGMWRGYSVRATLIKNLRDRCGRLWRDGSGRQIVFELSLQIYVGLAPVSPGEQTFEIDLAFVECRAAYSQTRRAEIGVQLSGIRETVFGEYQS